jgi:hypothetical protein
VRSIEMRIGGAVPVLLAVLASSTLAAPAAPVPAGKPIGSGEEVEVVGQRFPEELARGLPEGTKGWLPYYVELRTSRDRPVPVELTGVTTGVGAPWRFAVRRKVEVPPGAPTRVWLYVRYEGRGDLSQFRATIKIKGPNLDRELLRSDFGMGSAPDERPVPMIMAGERTRTSVSAWGERTLGDSREPITSTRTERMEERELPDLCAGYDAVGVLLLRNPDGKALEPAQVEAIRRWVSGGGFVILVPSMKGEVFRSPLFKALLPDAEVGELKTRPGMSPADLFSVAPESPEATVRRSQRSGGAEEHAYTVLDPVRVKTRREIVSGIPGPGPGAAPLPGAVRVYYEAALGEGRVGVMTLDDLSFSDDGGLSFRKRLWGLILDGDVDSRRLEKGRPGPEPLLDAIAAGLRSSLTREIGVGFITFLVLAYLVLIGPGVYLVLKKLKRLPALVWVEPAVVVVYLGIIAATAYITKGVLTRYSVVSVIEHSAGEPYAIKRTGLGLFSAAEARYRISAPGSELLQPVGAGAEEAIDLELGPAPERPALHDFRIPQWGTATFAASGSMEWPPGAGVEVTALEPMEAGKERLLVKNRTGFAIRKGFLRGVSGREGIVAIPPIPAGGEVEVAGEVENFKILDLLQGKLDSLKPADGKGDRGPARPAPEVQLLAKTVEAVLAFSKGRRQVFIGVIEREEQDYAVDLPSSLERRLDLLVERW